MPVTWPTSGRTPGQAMDYIRQIKAFTAFSQLFQTNSHENVKLENSLFKLHSQWTVMILMVGTMFVSMRQYFGEPIECLAGRSDVPPAMLQHYCWLEATFSVAEADGKAVVGPQVAYPGVKPLTGRDGEKKVFHKYYQWVYFVLIIQSILFYIPKFLWKAKEGKRLRTLIADLRTRRIDELKENDQNRVLQDLVDSLLLSRNYFGLYFACEVFFFIHLVIQIWFVNIFLGGQFWRLGWDWLYYSHENQISYDPLIRIFPRMTKCLFHKYGYSGSIERHDALCFLPLNIVNEKLYVVLWFWFAFLLIWTVGVLLYQYSLIMSHSFRFRMLQVAAPSTHRRYLRGLTERIGNYFILEALANNLKPSHFALLIETLVREHFDSNCKIILSNTSKPMGGHALNSSAPPPPETMSKLSAAISGNAPPLTAITNKAKKGPIKGTKGLSRNAGKSTMLALD